jgi:nicotinic acid phosphoribosyltransferase
MLEGLGPDAFIGTSNVHIAMRRDIEAIGTNAHELPMVYSALAQTDEALARAPYDVLSDWHDEHDGNLRIILPDTYGTKGFLERAPDWLAGWTGIRIDSGDPQQPPKQRSTGGNPAVKTRPKNWSSSPMAWMSTKSSNSTINSLAASAPPLAGAP